MTRSPVSRNRALLDDRIEQALQRARRTADAFALMVVDLDGFKEVNDIRGHDAGDQVLQSIARRLESVVRSSDTVARVGGDEFVVLSIGTRTEEEAAALVGRLRHALRRPYRVEGGIVEIDASIGWALFPADGATPEELLCRADVQMFATKRDSGDGSAASRRGSLDAGIVREFESALTRDEVVVHYQPVLDARSGEVQGVEALIRRNHPERGLLAPADFVPHVERTPLIRALTLHVVAEALGNARTLGLHERCDRCLGERARTARSTTPSWPTASSGLLETTGVSPHSLTLEVVPSGPGRRGRARPESARTADASKASGSRSTTSAARRRSPRCGCCRSSRPRSTRASCTGWGAAAPTTRSSAAWSASPMTLASTVAEGVETREAWDALAAMGCDRAQGFYVQQALPADKLAEWLEHSWPAVALAG